MYVDSWEIMRKGANDQALHQMRDNYDRQASTSHAMELGVAYLWLHDYPSAFDHLDRFNRRYPRHSHCTYDMAGVAKWCLHRQSDAVFEWQEGTLCEFADAGGLGAKSPLLLFFASVAESDLFARKSAEELMIKRMNGRRVDIWPAPLMQFALGQIDVETVRRKGIDKKYEDSTALHHWQADFWRGVQEYAQGNVARYHELMRQTANISWEEHDSCDSLFLSKLWCPEFFLARHEAR